MVIVYMRLSILAIFLFFEFSSEATAAFDTDKAFILTQRFNNHAPIKSWHELVTESVVMQEFDYSCGAAAIATILNQFYGEHVSERLVLDVLGKASAATFADLSAALPKFGFKGVGLSSNFQQLTMLKVPVIVAVRFDADNDHFSVLRGIDADFVWLADSSKGNMLLPVKRFLRAWEIRNDSAHRGKVLLVLPDRLGKVNVRTNYFGTPIVSNIIDSVFGGHGQRFNLMFK